MMTSQYACAFAFHWLGITLKRQFQNNSSTQRQQKKVIFSKISPTDIP